MGGPAVGGAPAQASAAGPSGSCGPAGQPCTWNFGPSGGSASGADVYAGQSAGRQGAGVLVAVVDTWVDPSHPDFTGRVVGTVDCIGGSCSGAEKPDSCTHGTHVAGTIASASYGVAPEADVLAVQVLNDGGSAGAQCSGTPSDVANGISYAVAHHARVINLSLGELVPGVLQDSSIASAVSAAAGAGVVVVFAAGNSSLPVTDSYSTDALLVAATGPSGSIASYSDYSGSVAIAAPGGDDGGAGLFGCTQSDCVLSTFPPQTGTCSDATGGCYALDEGTSMAAPHVSGAAALLFAENPSRSRDDVIHALEATAHPLSGAGSGLLDIGRALALEPAGASTGGSSPGAGGGSVPPSPRSTPTPGTVAYRSSVAGAVTPTGVTLAPTASPATPSTIPPVPTTVGGASPRRSAAGPLARQGGTSLAVPGAIAVLLLLAAGVGSGVVGNRRRSVR